MKTKIIPEECDPYINRVTGSFEVKFNPRDINDFANATDWLYQQVQDLMFKYDGGISLIHSDIDYKLKYFVDMCDNEIYIDYDRLPNEFEKLYLIELKEKEKKFELELLGKR